MVNHANANPAGRIVQLYHSIVQIFRSTRPMRPPITDDVVQVLLRSLDETSDLVARGTSPAQFLRKLGLLRIELAEHLGYVPIELQRHLAHNFERLPSGIFVPRPQRLIVDDANRIIQRDGETLEARITFSILTGNLKWGQITRLGPIAIHGGEVNLYVVFGFLGGLLVCSSPDCLSDEELEEWAAPPDWLSSAQFESIIEEYILILRDAH